MMKNNKKILRNIDRKLKYSRVVKYIKLIEKDEEKQKILIAIYFIESYYRNRKFRFCENMILINSFIINKRKIKNYTVGIMQVGLANILIHYGFENVERHIRVVENFENKHKYYILKGLYWKENLQIARKLINLHYEEACRLTSDIGCIRGIVGELYNGREEYALLLLKIIDKIEK